MKTRFVLPNPETGENGTHNGVVTYLTTCDCGQEHPQSNYPDGTMCMIQSAALQLEAQNQDQLAEAIKELETMQPNKPWINQGYGSTRDFVLYIWATKALDENSSDSSRRTGGSGGQGPILGPGNQYLN